MKKSILFSLTASILIMSSCGGSQQDHDHHHHHHTQEPTTTVEARSDGLTPLYDGEIILNAGDDMKYELTTIRVKAGEEIKLRLVHTGKMSKTAMGHNFVLLKKDVVLGEFANKAIDFKDADYIPDGGKDVIASTKMLSGGESDLITFTVEAGTYDYLCSFPGHAAMMKGKLIAE